MLRQSKGPRARTILPEAPDPPSQHGVSACAGRPDLSSPDEREALERALSGESTKGERGDSPGDHGVEARPRIGRLGCAETFAVGVQEVLDSPAFRRVADVVEVETTSATPGSFASWPDFLRPEVTAAWMGEEGIERPYAHQVEAMAHIGQGRDVVLATSTASGKSLCYQAPLLDAVVRDPAARALLLFPTKALARDQVESMRKVGSRLGAGMGTFDGDTPPDQRRATRARAHFVATNPDMLHQSILPSHDRFSALFAGLRFVVLDELHTYRGVFGGHVANVLRRLWRVCARYGSRPQIIACSATIANPGALATALTGREHFELVTKDTSPKGPRSFVIVNPTVTDEITGVRRDYLKVSRVVTNELRKAGVGTLAFCRTRKAVELLTRYLREDEALERVGVPTFDGPIRGPKDPGARAAAHSHVRGYRGGYLPDRRREVEQALRSGEAKVVAATNALELGIDIGGVDAVVLAGYPGTRAATWQRAGRAGRRGQPALNIMVLSSRPLDQAVASDTQALLGRSVEHARVDPSNPEVLIPHLRCAAHEVPFEVASSASTAGLNAQKWADASAWEGLDASSLAALLEALGERGILHREEDEAGERSRYFTLGAASPARQVNLRGPIEENFEVVEEAPDRAEHGRILAEVNFEDGPLYLHPGAIYPIEGETYEVRRLDWKGRKAYVRAVDSAYYTEAICHLRVRVIEPLEVRGDAGVGYAQVARAVPGFKKLRFRTHENIGFGPVNLPDLDLHTVAAWWRISAKAAARVAAPERRAAAVLGVAHLLHHAAAMLTMCDVRDLGHAVGTGGQEGSWACVGSHKTPAIEMEAWGHPTIYLYDVLSGGAGLSGHVARNAEQLFQRARRMLDGCRCEAGCVTCLGAESSHEGSLDGPRGHRQADVRTLLDGLEAGDSL